MKIHTIQEFIDNQGVGYRDEPIELVGTFTNEYPSWKEKLYLFRLEKKLNLEDGLRLLGNELKTLKGMYGLQEVDVTRPDNYYILIYELD